MLRANSALGLLLCSMGVVLVGCGDGEESVGSTSPTTGGASNASSSATQAGALNSAGGSVNTSRGGSSASVGGAQIGGSHAGGSRSSVTESAGAPSGGTSGSETQSSAGTSNTNASTTTGGTPSTGGTTNTNGGVAGGGTLPACIQFITPAANQKLAIGDDANTDCSDGIQIDVTLASQAPNGSQATLTMTGSNGTPVQLATTTVEGPVVRFTNVGLPSTGQVSLSVTVGDSSCTAAESLVLNCAGVPTCSVVSPIVNPSVHPALNGVPATSGGDRANASNLPLQVAVVVGTDMPDGRSVVLTADGTAAYQAWVSGGKATFPAVLLSPDGDHTLNATCTPSSGPAGSTGDMVFPVDTTAPALTVKKGKGAGATTISPLQDGDHFGLDDDADSAGGLQLKLCAQTSSADAIGLPATNPHLQNFCVRYGGGTPICSATTAGNELNACVSLTCPGRDPFSLDLLLTDAAGNTANITRSNLTCASELPTAPTFVDPVSDTEFTDPSLRILSAKNEAALRKDKSAADGAQYDVIACTNSPVNSDAVLSTGLAGGTLAPTGTPTKVAADSLSKCSGANLIVFSSVTLPESTVNAAYQLLTPTRLRITVTESNLASASTTADVWVDSADPSFALVDPTPASLCGSFINTSGTGSSDKTLDLTYSLPIPVAVTVQQPTSGAKTFNAYTLGATQTTVAGVILEGGGTNTISAKATKPSGNYAVSSSCAVDVGLVDPPSVTWPDWQPSQPGDPQKEIRLAAADNAFTNPSVIVVVDDKPATGGWQGTLKACTDLDLTKFPGATIQFSAKVGDTTTNIGAPVPIDASNGNCAVLTNATVPEGIGVTLKATTSAVAGVTGVGSINVNVDSTKPPAVSGFGAVVKERRQTSMGLSWTAPSDTPTGSVSTYKVRYSKSVIDTDDRFNNLSDTDPLTKVIDVPFVGSASAPGVKELMTIKDLIIENDYYFAVAPVDSVGNVGAIQYTTTATRAKFIQKDIVPPSSGTPNMRFGGMVDGTGDVNGDTLNDLLTTYQLGNEVDIFFGNTNGPAAAASVRIVGTTSPFGSKIGVLGDINKDGYDDFAIATPNEAAAPSNGNGVVYVYYGRPTSEWGAKASWAPSDANIVITADSSGANAPFASARLGISLARLGDFNGDKIDDYAVGASGYGTSVGLVAVMLGVEESRTKKSTRVLPSAFGVSAIRIDSEGVKGSFGNGVLGLGYFYGGNQNTTLLATAYTLGGNTGRAYSFLGSSDITTPLSATHPQHSLTGAATEYLAIWMAALGNVGPSSQPAFGVSYPYASPTRVDVLSGDGSAGPFALRGKYRSSESTGNEFGRIVVGGGISGRSATASLIGSARSDIAISTRASGQPRLLVISGEKIVLPFDLNVEDLGVVDAAVPLTASFTDFSPYTTVIPDLDGDTFADLAIAEMDYGGTPVTGHVLVLR